MHPGACLDSFPVMQSACSRQCSADSATAGYNGTRTWYSHCDGITSALMPEMLMPAYMQHFRCASTTSRAMAAPAPALRAQRHSMGAGMSAPAEGLTKRGESSKEVWC